MTDKRQLGQFFTKGNPFELKPFIAWAKTAGLQKATILEPFAGANHIIKSLIRTEQCREFASYDVAPKDKGVKRKDTIKHFPKGYNVCITNPPWLARNSATRRGLDYPNTEYDDLYKHCLKLCLDNCKYVAALIPASYLQSRLFRERLQSYILLHDTIFDDTENPVCLALFTEEPCNTTAIYYDNNYIDNLAELASYMPNKLEIHIPEKCGSNALRFNDPHGELGFISFDNTKQPSIRFCEVEEIAEYAIKGTSRFITRIGGEFSNLPKTIKLLNKKLNEFRKDTHDIFLTPFKGLRQDGQYRRRMEYTLARRLIN